MLSFPRQEMLENKSFESNQEYSLRKYKRCMSNIYIHNFNYQLSLKTKKLESFAFIVLILRKRI